MLGCEVMVVTRSISDVSDNVRMSGHGCLSNLPAVCLLCSKGSGQGCIFMQYCTLLHVLPSTYLYIHFILKKVATFRVKSPENTPRLTQNENKLWLMRPKY